MFPPQACFTCARCKRPFPTGERVTFTGKSCLCQACIQVVASSLLSPSSSSWQHNHHNDNIYVQGDKDSGGIGSRSQIGNVGDDTCAGYQPSTINHQPSTSPLPSSSSSLSSLVMVIMIILIIQLRPTVARGSSPGCAGQAVSHLVNTLVNIIFIIIILSPSL